MSHTELDAVVVGAGFSGLYALHRLRKMGLQTRALEAADGVGGTWYYNRYPGARCDVTIIDYSYQFDKDLQQEWEWQEKYATQPELLNYINHVTDRFDLREDIVFNTLVVSAVFDDASSRWHVTTDDGTTYSARFCVFATGNLSTPLKPDYPGFDDFAGEVFYTSSWPQEGVDFTGRRVGVIGTGSSAIQTIPLVAEQADSVTVFQRTANYCIPAHNAPLDPEYVADVKANYDELRKRNNESFPAADFGESHPSAHDLGDEEREAFLEEKWAQGGLAIMLAFDDQLSDPGSNEYVAEFVRNKIRAVVDDPATADLLCPSYPIGTKRLCVDTDYYKTYNRDNVHLVDIKSAPIQQFSAEGLATSTGTFEFDTLIVAAGFDAMTGTLNKMNIQGRGGARLSEHWAEGPRLYLGMAAAGFPNLFIVTGPGSPIAFVNNLTAIEQSVEWITDAIQHVVSTNLSTIEAEPSAEKEWVDHVAEVADTSLFTGTDSWYMGANVPGKPRVLLSYLGGFPVYLEKCEEVVANNYAGFTLAG